MTAGRTRASASAALAVLSLSGASRCELATDASSGRVVIVVGTVEETGTAGCWRLRTSDGAGYELRSGQAPAEVLRQGRRLKAEIVARVDLESSCGGGVPADVERVLSLEQS